jgi:hypothetical protein
VKLAAVTLLKTEFDIIELFFRINSRVFDSFIVIDTMFQNPPDLFNKLKTWENIDITVYTDYSDTLEDNYIIRKALLSTLQKKHFDWVCILDPDKFINIERSKLEEELSRIPRNEVASLAFTTWVPKNNNYDSFKNPLWSNFEKRNYELANQRRVFIPSGIIKDTVPSRTGHAVHPILPDESLTLNARNICRQHTLTCGTIDHVPVRSAEQIMIETLIGSAKLNSKKDRFSYENPHWDVMAEMIIKYDFNVDDFLLRYLALTYGSLELTDTVNDDVDSEARLGLKTDEIKYEYIYSLNVVRFYHRLCSYLYNRVKRK